MGLSYILDAKTREPISVDVLTGTRWWRDNYRVAYDVIDDMEVSTVFLGVDHGWEDGPPVLWETILFGAPHEVMEWYTSEADAIEGHKRMVERVKAGEFNPGLRRDDV